MGMLVLFVAVKLTLMILKGKKTNPNAKCKKSWFKDACVVSCCKANSDDSEKKKKQTRMRNVKRAGSKMLVLFLAVKLTLMILKRKKTNPNAKCKKIWFKDACVVSCCNANSDDSEKEKKKPECEM